MALRRFPVSKQTPVCSLPQRTAGSKAPTRLLWGPPTGAALGRDSRTPLGSLCFQGALLVLARAECNRHACCRALEQWVRRAPCLR